MALNSTQIAAFVHYLNTVTMCVALFLAVCGVFFIINRIARLNLFQGALFFPALCVAALAALGLEAAVFNLPVYLRFFSGDEVGTTMIASSENPNVLLTTDGTVAEMTYGSAPGGAPSGVIFRNLNRKVTSVRVKCDFSDTEQAQIAITRVDEEGIRSFRKRVYKLFPYLDHTPVYASGKVDLLEVTFAPVNSEGAVSVAEITINKPIPFFISGLRLMAVSLLIFALFALFNKTLRAGASFYLFEYRVAPASRKQGLVYAFAAALLLFFVWVNVYTSIPDRELKTPTPSSLMYNKHLVDAIIAGRTWLDAGNPEKLLAAGDSIYDVTWRIANDSVYTREVDWLWDWTYYNGKFYCYNGVVPAVLLYVPYMLITGNYLSNHAGVFIFAAISVILLALLWRHCVIKYMPDTRFAFYLLAFITLFLASGYQYVLRGAGFSSLVQIAGYAFAFAGILLLLKSAENESGVKPVKLFFACLCLALSVGCRPNFVLASAIVPFFLWKRRSWKLLLPVALPYIAVAIPLCLYNYARFGSIAEFGGTYVLTAHRNDVMGMLNPIGKAVKAFVTGVFYLFQTNRYSFTFPFVDIYPRHRVIIEPYLLQYNHPGSGIINYPIVFCLFYLFKNIKSKDRPKSFGVPLAFFALGAVMLVSFVLLGLWFQGRYILDYATFLILASLFCAYYWSNCVKSELSYRLRMKVLYVLCAASAFVGLFLFASVGTNLFINGDPVLYRYMEISLGIAKLGI